MENRYRLAISLIAFVCVFGLASPLIAGTLEDGLAAYIEGDFATALRLLKPLAEQGNSMAQLALGFMYAEGQGVPQDDIEAVKWYLKAAERGDADAQLSIGSIYYMGGENVPQNYVQAHIWFSIAAASASEKDDRQNAVIARDLAAVKMTPEEIAEAQDLATGWNATL